MEHQRHRAPSVREHHNGRRPYLCGDAQTIAIKEGTSLLAAEKTTEGTESATEAAGTQIEETTGAVSDDDLIDVTEQESEVKFQFEEEDTSTDDATGEFSQVYTYIIYK